MQPLDTDGHAFAAVEIDTDLALADDRLLVLADLIALRQVGNMPGMAASTSETWLLGAPPNSVEAPENSFALEVTWACTSMPMTTSQSPVEPRIRLPGFVFTSMR
jgi:hypothetical protein